LLFGSVTAAGACGGFTTSRDGFRIAHGGFAMALPDG
jgi:hypothetical protein